MKTGAQIRADIKPLFDRISDALKVLGSGNAAGLIALVTAMNTVTKDHPHSVLLLKPIAVIFALGVLTFALAYVLLMYAFAYAENYASALDRRPRNEPIPPAVESAQSASTRHFMLSTFLALASTFLFFLGFILTCIAIIRY
jgi:hypothetical protein